MIDIRDKNSAIRASVEVTDQCIYSKKLMEEEYILLSFESDVLISFTKGDFIQTEFGIFSIVEINRPHQTSNGGYLYEQKFHADWERWRNRIVFYDRQNGSEKSWKMTQSPEYFLDIIISNLQSAGFGSYTFAIDSELTEMKLIEFDSTNIIDGLTKIAETWNSEWWFSDNIIHLSKCEFGTPIELSENIELGIIDREDSSDTDYFTRAYVFGATRNLPKNYRKNEDSSVVIEGVVETRLKLPAEVPYIDAWENMKDDDVVEGIILFDEVYPRRIGTITTVATKKYTDEIENDDGSKTYNDWNAFRFTDTNLIFSADYILPGEELRIVFQSGKLAGMDFAVIFNPNGVSEAESSAQVFEIIRNDSYGVNLPTDDFKPAVGDTYILYGYDTQFVYNQLLPEAEQELYTKGREKLALIAKDKSVYNCPTNPVRCAGYLENASGALVHSAIEEIDLDVGQAVNLKSNIHFADGYRLSRVRGFEKKLRNKYEATYIIGETSAYSRSEALEERVQQLTYQSKQFLNTYGNSVYVVGRYDTTAPSDTNVPSFKRAISEFLQKTKPDRTPYKLASDIGFEVGDFEAGVSGGCFHMDDDGHSYAELDKLYVRIKAFFEELTIIKKGVLAGDQYITPGGGVKCVRVEETDTAYRCYFLSGQDGELTDCAFVAGDQAIARMFNARTGTTNKVSNHSYWRLVTEVVNDAVTDEAGNHYGYIALSKTDCEGGSDDPQAGDEICQFGNRTDTDRQCALLFSTTAADAPCVKLYTGISSYSLEGKSVVSFGRDPQTGKIFFRLGATGAMQFLEYNQETGLTVAGKISSQSTVVTPDGMEKTLSDAIDEGKAPNLMSRYSSDATAWHTLYQSGDLWMQTSNDGGQTWGEAVRIQGASYAPNLLKDTKTGFTDWRSDHPTASTITPAIDSDGFRVMTQTLNISGGSHNAYHYITNMCDNGKDATFIKGKTYTLSFDYKSVDEINVQLGRLGGVGGYFTSTNIFAASGEWKRASFSFVSDADGSEFTSPFIQAHIRNGIGEVGDTASFRKFCLVEGTSTEWTPAASEMIGKDGQYRKHQWAIGTTTSVTGSWQDAPMTASTGQYIWMRSGIVVPPATTPASYDQPIRLTGDTGAAGQSVYTLDLSDEMMPMACDASGNVVGSYKTSQASVFKGTTKITSGITYSIAQATGISATITPAGLVTPSALTADTATIVVQAVVDGLTLQTTLSLYKVRPGQNGQPGTDGSNFTENLLLDEYAKGTTNTSVIDHGIEIAANSNQDTYFRIYTDSTLVVSPGDVFTFSCDVEGLDSDGTWSFIIFNSANSACRITLKNGRCFATFTATASYSGTSILPDDQTRVSNSKPIRITNAKLERGVNEHPVWTPAASEMVGQDAVVYSLELSANNITRDALGNLSATSITVQKYKTTGASARALTTEKTVRYQRIGLDSSTTTLSTATSSYTIPIPTTEPNRSKITAIIVELLDGTTILDRERIPVISEGSRLSDNLVKDSEYNAYGTKYDLVKVRTTEDLVVGETYTFTIWGQLGSGRSWNFYDNLGSVYICAPTKIGNYDGGEIYSAVATFPTGMASRQKNIFTIYQVPNSSTNPSKVHRVKIEKDTNLSPVWTASPKDMDYLKAALQESGSIEGGLVLASLMRLGYTQSNGEYVTMAGMNGIYNGNDKGGGLMLWGGGEMIDPDGTRSGTPATSGIRLDGTAFFCNNVIRLEKNRIMVGDVVQLASDGLTLIDGSNNALRIGDVSVPDLMTAASSSGTLSQSSFSSGTINVYPEGNLYVASNTSINKTALNGNTVLPAGAVVTIGGTISVPQMPGVPLNDFGATVVVEFYLDNTLLQTAHLNLQAGNSVWSTPYNTTLRLPNSGKLYGILRFDYPIPTNSPVIDGSPFAGATFIMNTRSWQYSTSNQNTLGKNGFLAAWGQSLLYCGADGVEMRFNNTRLRLDTNGIRKSTNNGSSWSNL